MNVNIRKKLAALYDLRSNYLDCKNRCTTKRFAILWCSVKCLDTHAYLNQCNVLAKWMQTHRHRPSHLQLHDMFVAIISATIQANAERQKEKDTKTVYSAICMVYIFTKSSDLRCCCWCCFFVQSKDSMNDYECWLTMITAKRAKLNRFSTHIERSTWSAK